MQKLRPILNATRRLTKNLIGILVWISRAYSVLATLLLAFSSPVIADTLTVAVAANVQYVFDDLQAEFQKQTRHKLKLVFGSSGKLTAQIMNGAPYDVFRSADMEYPEKFHKEGFSTAAPKVYAQDTLVLCPLKDIDLNN